MRYIDTEEAAAKLGIQSIRVAKLCREGLIEGAIKQGRQWKIPSDSILPGKNHSHGSAMQQRKPLPIGVSDYIKAVTQYRYVDKTLMIRDFLDTIPTVSLFTRPRRFGKTLNMDMMRVFFEKTDHDTSIYFHDTDIERCGMEYMKEQGKYPVIFLTFKDVKQTTWKEALCYISSLISTEFIRHGEIQDSDMLNEEEKDYYMSIVSRTASETDLSMSLQFLSRMLDKINDKPPVIIIDEYDTPVQSGWVHDYYDEVIAFTKTLFSGAFKDNKHLSWGFLTGILRIAEESIFSGLNNLRDFSIMDERFSSYFGFTAEEVESLLKEYGGEGKMEEVASWYDGYSFGSNEIYNPWSVMYYIDNDFSPRAYWANTDSNDILRKLLLDSTEEIRDEMQKLMNGDSIITDVSNTIVYPDMNKNPESIWSFLLTAGYLRIKGKAEWHGIDATCQLAIPNRETWSVYAKEINKAFLEGVSSSTASKVRNALLSHDMKGLEMHLQEFLIDSISSFDTSGELFYQGLILGIASVMNNMYRVTSNRESGTGRYDISLSPQKDPTLPGILIELKVSPTEEHLAELAETALTQIKDKLYDHEMRKNGITSFIRIGMAFSRKNVKVLSEVEL